MVPGGDEMSFWDHLEALRGTIWRSVLGVLLSSVASLLPQGAFQGRTLAYAARFPALQASWLRLFDGTY